jgi:probable HAF family extracellular repeat protein
VKRSILGVLLVLTFVAVGIAAAPPLTFTFKDVHATKTALETDTYAVNDFGTIAGDFLDASGVQHGMIHGIPTTSFDYSKCTAGIAAYGINKSCTVAGWCTGSTGEPIGFTRAKDGTFTDINFPNGIGTEATGINDKGDVVGLYFDANGAQHGFLLKAGSYTSIDVPSESSTAAWGINNAGQITVYATNSSGDFDSFLYNGTTFKNINDPNANGTLGTVVHTPNNKGDIDGTYYDSSGNTHGWLLHGGTYYDVNDPNGANLSRADGLNDKLEIVGRYTPSTGGNVGFRALTTP